ncbi:MAG: DUF433 domain-containing protein [Tepidisphaeraceae bacterium]
MSDAPKQYVITDEHGVMRVAGTRVMLDSVLAGWQEGQSPESIRESYPALSLEQVYGAIAHILAHPGEIAAYVRRQDEVWARFKAECDANPPPVVLRLRALQRSRELPTP